MAGTWHSAWTVMVQGDKKAPEKFQLEMDLMIRRINSSKKIITKLSHHC